MKAKLDFIIREITLLDAAAFLKLRMQSEKETPMMGYRAGERKETVLQAAKKLKIILASKDAAIFVATVDGSLVGFVMVYANAMKIYSKSRGIAIAVLKKYWRRGVAIALMKRAIVWSKDKKVHRLELDVWAHNIAAIKLYKKFGFKKEGVAQDSIYLNGKFVNVLNMGLILKK